MIRLDTVEMQPGHADGNVEGADGRFHQVGPGREHLREEAVPAVVGKEAPKRQPLHGCEQLAPKLQHLGLQQPDRDLADPATQLGREVGREARGGPGLSPYRLDPEGAEGDVACGDGCGHQQVVDPRRNQASERDLIGRAQRPHQHRALVGARHRVRFVAAGPALDGPVTDCYRLRLPRGAMPGPR